MKYAFLILALTGAALADNRADSRLYEMRTYHAESGKLDSLLARFRDHTTKLFEKRGMTNIGSADRGPRRRWPA